MEGFQEGRLWRYKESPLLLRAKVNLVSQPAQALPNELGLRLLKSVQGAYQKPRTIFDQH
jgi:hypothetical protein